MCGFKTYDAVFLHCVVVAVIVHTLQCILPIEIKGSVVLGEEIAQATSYKSLPKANQFEQPNA